MKQIITFFTALVLFFLIEFLMMVLYTTLIEKNVSIDSIIGKVFYGSSIIIFVGGFFYMLVRMQIAQMKHNKNAKQKKFHQ